MNDSNLSSNLLFILAVLLLPFAAVAGEGQRKQEELFHSWTRCEMRLERCNNSLENMAILTPDRKLKKQITRQLLETPSDTERRKSYERFKSLK